jgi:hypothetical protein
MLFFSMISSFLKLSFSCMMVANFDSSSSSLVFWTHSCKLTLLYGLEFLKQVLILLTRQGDVVIERFLPLSKLSDFQFELSNFRVDFFLQAFLVGFQVCFPGLQTLLEFVSLFIELHGDFLQVNFEIVLLEFYFAVALDKLVDFEFALFENSTEVLDLGLGLLEFARKLAESAFVTALHLLEMLVLRQ